MILNWMEVQNVFVRFRNVEMYIMQQRKFLKFWKSQCVMEMLCGFWVPGRNKCAVPNREDIYGNRIIGRVHWNKQPATRMTNEIQILWKWIDCITTNAWRQWLLGRSAARCVWFMYIMTLTLAYIHSDWDAFYFHLNSSGFMLIARTVAKCSTCTFQYFIVSNIFSLFIFRFVCCVRALFVHKQWISFL